jgi:hypothetical protein
MLKKASSSDYTSAIMVSPHLLSHAPSTSSTMKTPADTEENPDDPGPADEGGIQMEYSD